MCFFLHFLVCVCAILSILVYACCVYCPTQYYFEGDDDIIPVDCIISRINMWEVIKTGDWYLPDDERERVLGLLDDDGRELGLDALIKTFDDQALDFLSNMNKPRGVKRQKVSCYIFFDNIYQNRHDRNARRSRQQ